MDHQGKCSHKHRLFTLSFSLGSSCLAQLFSAFQPSLQGQNDYILTETATRIQQLNPVAKAPFSTIAKKQIHFLTSRKALLTPAAGANAICHLLYGIVSFSHSHCCSSGRQGTPRQEAKSQLPLGTIRNCHFPLQQQRLLPLNLTGKAAHAGTSHRCPIPCKG